MVEYTAPIRAMMETIGCTGCCTTMLEMVEKHAGKPKLPAMVGAVIHRGLSSKGLTDCGIDGKAQPLSIEPSGKGITCPACLKAQLDKNWASPAADAHYTYEQLQALALWHELGGWPFDRASAGGEAAGRLWGYEHRRRMVQVREITPAAVEAYERVFGRGEGRWSGIEDYDRKLFIEAFRHGVSYWGKVETRGK